MNGVAAVTVSARADVLPGAYPVTLRATASGAADAVAAMRVLVTPSSIVISSDSSVTLVAGASTVLMLRIARLGFAGDVRVTTDRLPTGVTASVDPAVTLSDSVRVTIAAAANAPAGDDTLVLRAAPIGLMPTAERTMRIRVTVRAPSGNAGNAILDVRHCSAPTWIAVLDGTGAWQRLRAVDGTARFSVTEKGGVAWIDGASLNVRYLTESEFSAAPLSLCAPPSGAKRLLGTGLHGAVGEVWTYAFGGISAASTMAVPEFSFDGVPNGAHDLLGYAALGATARFLIRRDINVANGESIGSFSLTGAEAFNAVQRPMAIAGTVQSGDLLSYSLDYLTRDACTANAIFTRAPIGTSFSALGIPETYQRVSDFHQLTVRSASTVGVRTATMVMHALETRSITLPNVIVTPDVRTLAGPYKRLQLTLSAVPPIYTGPIALQYQDRLQSMSVSASRAYAGSAAVTLAMPDLSGVSDWVPAAAIGRDVPVQWTLSIDGGDLSVPRCTEGRTTVRVTRVGNM